MMSQNKSDRWNAALYDNHHAFVSSYGDHLLNLLAPQKAETILDLGCGTGDLAMKLLELQVNVVGIDQSETMINQARRKYQTIPFFVKNAIDLGYDEEFEAVFSNAVLHWVKPPSLALTSIYHALKPGGRFVAEFGGKDNVQRIIDAIIMNIKQLGRPYAKHQLPWYFPSIGEYTTLMEQAGFSVTFAQAFDRPTRLTGDAGLRNWINMFAASLFDGIDHDSKNMIMTAIEKQLKPTLYKEDSWLAEYKRIRVIGIKE